MVYVYKQKYSFMGWGNVLEIELSLEVFNGLHGYWNYLALFFNNIQRKAIKWHSVPSEI